LVFPGSTIYVIEYYLKTSFIIAEGMVVGVKIKNGEYYLR